MKKMVLIILSFIFVSVSFASSSDSSLRAYWNFDVDLSDQSGNGNNLTVRGNSHVSLPPGVYGNCVDLSRNSTDETLYSFLEAPHSSSLSLDGSEATFMFYIKPTEVKDLNPSSWTDREIILNKEFSYQIGLSPSLQIKYAFAYESMLDEITWRWVNTPVTVSNGEWTHIALVFDPCGIKIYRNQILAYSADHVGGSGGIKPSTKVFRIGSRAGFERDYFIGQIDEVRIYSRALTENEIKSLSNPESVSSSTPDSQGDSPEVNDSSECDYSTYQEEIDKLFNENSDLKQEIETLQTTISDLEKQIETLNQKLTNVSRDTGILQLSGKYKLYHKRNPKFAGYIIGYQLNSEGRPTAMTVISRNYQTMKDGVSQEFSVDGRFKLEISTQLIT